MTEVRAAACHAIQTVNTELGSRQPDGDYQYLLMAHPIRASSQINFLLF